MREAVDVARAGWDAYFAGDIEGVIAMMFAEIETDLTRFEGWPEDPVYYGHDGFRRFITEWLAGWDRYEAGLHELVETSPGCIFTISWQRGYGSGSQVPVEMNLAEIITIRDSRLARLELWSDVDLARAEALARR